MILLSSFINAVIPSKPKVVEIPGYTLAKLIKFKPGRRGHIHMEPGFIYGPHRYYAISGIRGLVGLQKAKEQYQEVMRPWKKNILK